MAATLNTCDKEITPRSRSETPSVASRPATGTQALYQTLEAPTRSRGRTLMPDSGVWELFLRGHWAAGRGFATLFASSSRLLMVPEEQPERPWSLSTVHSSHILCPSPLGPGPSQVEARIARLVLGINNSSRRITTLVSTIADIFHPNMVKGF